MYRSDGPRSAPLLLVCVCSAYAILNPECRSHTEKEADHFGGNERDYQPE